MTVRITGPALLLGPEDAARLDQQLRDAIRLGWLARQLPPPRALLALADEVHRLANLFRADAQVSGPPESVAASLPPLPAGWAPPERLSVDQAAQIMGVSPQYVRKLARRSDVTASRAGGRGTPWEVDSASALAWVADRRQAQHVRKVA